ncbi:putative inactive receptor kinase [Sesamum angolense]|uniref:Inactive receptor kinase n=1 Tax=Sesamum angolense TaxID=2727404 RepID=A0AAE1W1P4_9LAMI|nr:putative inactive receptor kinase [Sesamum angolense]
MSAIYDNWERLVAAVLRKQQLWELFHDLSRSPSIRSEASDFSSSFNLSSPLHSLAFDFPNGSFASSRRAPPKLVHISDFSPAFDVNDVCLASAELLGRGTFGSAFMAAMNNGVRIVVKRLNKPVSIPESDFKLHMDIVGNVRHENVAALRAYYSSEDERLMLYDYYDKGSVYALLHGQTDESRLHVDWGTRFKIAIGAARGIAAVHAQNSGKLVHGNVKASNIFLNPQRWGCVSDLGLATIIGKTFTPTASCYAPEVRNTQNVSQASDVYSFGILILELVTRRSPAHFPGGPMAVDLVKLVGSVRSKEKAAERLKDVHATFKEFQQLMGVTWRMPHENVAELRGCFFHRDEKFLIYDYYNRGNVSARLHGRIATGKPPLDWETRLKIAVGAARGITHIHRQDGGKLVHGNIKSSNIFLSQQLYGLVSDVGFTKLMNPVRRTVLQGYWAPEVKDSTRVSQASDVYSFGVFLLELVSGMPTLFTTDDGEVISLIDWAHSTFGYNRTEVIDTVLLGNQMEEAMIEVLQIGMDCIATAPEHRPRMPQVVKMLEEISSIKPADESRSEDRWEQPSMQSSLEDLLDDLLPTLTP